VDRADDQAVNSRLLVRRQKMQIATSKGGNSDARQLEDRPT